jgi:hypothetical protein
MSKADEFRQYAEEAVHWACDGKNEKQKVILINLARAWARAAARQESPSARHDQAACHTARHTSPTFAPHLELSFAQLRGLARRGRTHQRAS